MDNDEQKPWYNDGDKIGGLAATIVTTGAALALGIFMIGLSIKLVTWIF